MLVEESLKQNNQTFLTIPERERENPLKLKEKNTRREAAGDRECRREMGFGGTRNSECIGCGRSPHSQSHVIFYVICVSGYLKRRGR